MPYPIHVRADIFLACLFTVMLTASCTQHHDSSVHETTLSPYAGEEARVIKALAPQEIEELESGEGMGMAKVAELNGLPGPRHVIDLREELKLTPDQLQRTEATMTTMKSEAIELGNEIVKAEARLDSLFASFAAAREPDSARELLMRTADLRGRLRWSHVAAHIAMIDILTEEQRSRYVQLRGYHNHTDAGHSDH